ncbi:MAG: epoxide hydrolase [Polyangiaceae bacterium]|nr:epoxide hydrolase [Polyangiaceae bacterium]
MTHEVEPFRIQVSDEVLTDLRARLSRARIPEGLPGAGWSQGTDPAYLRELCAYWRDTFDWRAAEAKLNRFDQYRTSIDGLGIHFIHVRSREPGAMPLVLSHGWPGSVMEFHKVIGPLADPAAHGGGAGDAFHVVCPSLPGYGFSDAPREPGWTPRRIAGVFTQLMARLGYTRYGAQGGDWGAVITPHIADLDPERVAGIHLNTVSAMPPQDDPMEGVQPDELAGVQAFQRFMAEESGYQAIQGTKPQSLGAALDDSPSGLAAWIVEKFRTWSDCDGDVERRFTKDELLTNVMIYWVTQTATSSARLYLEGMRAGGFGILDRRVEAPTGCALFPKEILVPPRAWAERAFRVARWTRMPRGGHFAALEEPELLVEDIRAFFRPLR